MIFFAVLKPLSKAIRLFLYTLAIHLIFGNIEIDRCSEISGIAVRYKASRKRTLPVFHIDKISRSYSGNCTRNAKRIIPPHDIFRRERPYRCITVLPAGSLIKDLFCTILERSLPFHAVNLAGMRVSRIIRHHLLLHVPMP